ncbi:MAG: PAS domain S-box protein [Bacteroidales bacterium]|nr:PAS domain S-box protein [Bacteroidales bacterium]
MIMWRDRGAVIITSNESIVSRAKENLTTLGFIDFTIVPNAASIQTAKPSSSFELIVLELNDESDLWLSETKGAIQEYFGFAIPIIIYAAEGRAKELVKKGLLSNFGYINHSFTLRELELCLEALPTAGNSVNKNDLQINIGGFQALFNLSPNGIIICSESGRIINANRILCDLLGYSLDELLLMQIKDLVPKDKHKQVDVNIQKVINGETLYSEVLNICKDGSSKYLDIVETRIILSNGRYGIVIMSSDITKWKEININLSESEEKYRILVEQSNDGIAYSQNGKLIFGNPKILELIGLSADEFIGQPIEKFIYSDKIEAIKDGFGNGQYGENISGIYETSILRANGKPLPVEFSAKNARFKGENITIIFIRDISKRKLAEKYLRESEESYRSVFDNASEAIYIQDLTGVFLDVNKAALKLYGYAKSEIVGHTPEKLSAPDKNDLEETKKRLIKAFEGETQFFEFWGKAKNGRIFPKEVYLNKGRYFGSDVVFAMAREISDRKNAEEILIESEEKYRTLAEQIPVGLYQVTLDGRFLYANLTLAKIIGFNSVAELMQHNSNEFYLIPNKRFDQAQRINNQSQQISEELKIVRKDGKNIWVRNNGQITYDKKGKILYVAGVIENITEQKEANEALRNSEANLRATLNAIPDQIFKFSKDGIYLDLPAIENEDFIIGFNKIIGKSIFEFFPSDFCNTLLSKINECLETSKLQSFEYSIMVKDELNFFEVRLVPIRVNEVLSFFRNITDKKKAEEKIRMLAQTIMNVQECISIEDLNSKLIYVNPAFLKTYGYEEDEVIGQPISIIQSHTTANNLPDIIQEATLKGGWQGELINKRKDGSEFPISLSTAVVRDENGEPLAFVGVANDITDRKASEQEVIAAKEKAEESDRLKTSFLANMSHEIRSPMNAVLGFIRILKEEEVLSEAGKQYIELISNSGMQLISIIEDIIDTSKIQANQLRLSIQEFDLNVLLADIFTVFSTQIKEKPTKSTLLLPPVLGNTSPFIINSDDLRIRQILINLLSNAVKFTPKGVIEFGYSIIIDDENPLIKLFVKDTGIGLAPEKQELIFERFRQADDSYTRVYGGSGLGLAISKGLIELLGGEIWVESEVDKGSTFYFTLPINCVFTEIKEKLDLVEDMGLNRVNGLNWSDKTFLIIEDIKDIQFYLKKVFERTGANLLFADSLKEARQLFTDNKRIDLVLLDIRLPDGDGYDLALEFKSAKPEIPIIAQTAFAMSGEREKSASYGCDDYITKPIDPDLLLLKIQNIFQKTK